MNNVLRTVRVAALLALAAPLLPAQTRPAASPLGGGTLVALPGNVPSFAQPRFDQGPVADSFAANRILLLLRRSPQQQDALDKFLRDANTPGNPRYHHWLTPAQFGEQYGPGAAEIGRVQAWLEQQGFTVSGVTQGRTAIEFSGTAGQLRQAFHTEIHSYAVHGQILHANNSDPKIPVSLAPLVLGLSPLSDVRPHPESVIRGREQVSSRTLVPDPQCSVGCSGYNCSVPQLLLSPGDFAVQYDVNPLYKAGVDGTGATIGVIGAANIVPADVATYRSFFSLPPLNVNVVVDGNDPGPKGAVVESEMDVEISGSVAPHASVDLYTAADTTLQSGLALAAQRAVDEDTADVLSVSYGECEQDLGASGNAFWNALWEQAAAQGQTVVVSSGDNGAATCDANDPVIYPNGPSPAEQGLTVNGLASSPWDLAIGGTDFYYDSLTTTQLASYWNLTTAAQPAVSLLQPVPEQPWNRPYGLNLFPGPANPTSIAAAGGGVSKCIAGTAASDGTIASCSGGYPKPVWQSGAGVPSDKARDLPDVSLFAAAGENDSAYPVCTVYANCTQQPNLGLVLTEAGGTSASAQAMAGILALVVQKYGRQGQAAWEFYPLATQHPEAFHDVAVGSNIVPCVKGSPDCTQSTSSVSTSGQYVLGYDAGAAYDLASGLGSVDVNALVSDWNQIHFTATTTDLSLSQTTFVHGTPVTAQVTVNAGGGTPTGQVALLTTATPASNTGLGTLTLAGGSASASTTSLPGGKYSVSARYGGDSTFAASESSPVAVNVTPEASVTTLSAQDWPFTSIGWASGWQPIANGGSYVYGDYIGVDAQIAGARGPDGGATGTVSFSTAGMTSGALAVNSHGEAEWSPPHGFPAGSYTITAAYSGDASFNGSTAAPFSFTVAKQTPLGGTDEGCTPNRVEYGTTTCLDNGIHVLLGQGVPPTGTVTYSLGSTVLGSAPLYCCDPPPPFPTPYLYLDGSIKVNNLPVGTNTITAQYSGDANYNAVALPAITITVTAAANISLSITPQPVTNNTFTVTANVAGSAGQPAPTGMIQFLLNNGDLGSGNATIANGSASYTFTVSPPAGTTSISLSAYYEGDTNYAPVRTQTTVNIGQPFSIAPATPALTLAAGKAQTNLSVTPAGGFTGSVSLQCALTSWPAGGNASAPACTIVPASVTIAGTAPGSAVVSFAAGTNVTAETRPWLLPGGAGLLAFVAFFGIPGRRRRSRGALFCVLLTLALFGGITACGMSQPHTPTAALVPGNYVYTVTGSSSQPSASGGQSPVTEQTQVTVTMH